MNTSPARQRCKDNEQTGRAPLWLIASLAVLAATPAWADIIFMRDGRRLVGRVTERRGDRTIVQLESGTADVAAADIVRVQPAPLPWELYEAEKKKYADTADDQCRLGLWCREHNMPERAATHFARALQIDPNHAATRQALGHSRVGDVWLELKPAATPSGTTRQPSPAQSPTPSAAEQELETARVAMRGAEQEMIRLIRAEWYKHILSIEAHYLRSPSKRRFNEGAEMMMAIRDPLAIDPMLQVLGAGQAAADERRILVAAVGRFKTSAATLGLLETALMDDARDVRKAALARLDGRNDPRIMSYLLKAVKSDDSDVVHNAAEALGYLRFVDSVPALVKCLTDKEVRRVRNEEVITSMRGWFVGPDGIARPLIVRSTVGNDPFHPDVREVTVTVFHTEIQEALIAITGENYGFNAEGWMGWYRRQKAAGAAPAQAPAAPQANPPVNAGNSPPANPAPGKG
ncbi:MAG: hypothetical protein BIFFINMI_03871 [Phycisphaerae bacterium]|nr:hypothetical protein [Phycisphaerae bacterium]